MFRCVTWDALLDCRPGEWRSRLEKVQSAAYLGLLVLMTPIHDHHHCIYTVSRILRCPGLSPLVQLLEFLKFVLRLISIILRCRGMMVDI